MAPGVRKRLSDKKLLGKLAKELTDQDVLAMGMVCLIYLSKFSSFKGEKADS